MENKSGLAVFEILDFEDCPKIAISFDLLKIETSN
jgi:hypothetical protein